MLKKLILAIIALVIIVAGVYALTQKSPVNKSYSTPVTTTKSAKTTPRTASIIEIKTAPHIGQYLANNLGQPLYTYGADSNGVSNCTGSCLSSWPIYAPTSSAASLPAHITIISRSDGSKQYAYKGMPLYTFTGDTNGQVTGDGVANFHVAKP